jgi:hypothetical protein
MNMDTAKLPDGALLRDFLAKGWLTHDGMWFYNAVQQLGIEQANSLNLAAIRSMAPLEVQRTKKILGIGKEQIGSMEELHRFMISALNLVLPASLLGKFTTTIISPDIFRWEWEKDECFAFKGISMTGCIDRYECGVMLRIRCWLDALGVPCRMEPEIKGCMMHEKGYCRGDIVCSFPG